MNGARPGSGGGPFKDPFPSPVRFLEDPSHSHRSGTTTPTTGYGSNDYTSRQTTSVPSGAAIRWRPPRKSIDAGKLARTRSHQSHTTVGGSSNSAASSPNIRPTGPGSGSGVGGDRRKSSGVSQKPRYRWLSQPGGGTGDEPGVDVRSRRDEEAYSGLKGKTTVTVVDYANSDSTGSGDREGREDDDIDEQEEEDEEDMNFRVEFQGERLGEWLDGEGKRKVGNDGKSVGVRWSKFLYLIEKYILYVGLNGADLFSSCTGVELGSY